MSKKALLIGINQYPEGHELQCCVEDIQRMAEVLAFNGDEQESRNFDVLCLPDVQSSSEAMAYIRELFARNDDMVLLYFSGHGASSQLGAELVFPEDMTSSGCYSGISMDDIVRLANKSAATNKVIILDCCHSGAMGMNPINKSTAVLGAGVTILTACRDDESALEGDSNGLFTDVLVQALSGGAADFSGNITIGGIYAYIDRSFGGWQQRPVFKTNVTAFAPIRKVEPKVKDREMRELITLFDEPDMLFPLDPTYEFTDPSAIEEHTVTFQKLQKFQSIGFVEPVDAKFMYFAAMESKACRLTPLGQYYWQLVANGRI